MGDRTENFSAVQAAGATDAVAGATLSTPVGQGGGPLDVAIAALTLAAQDGGELDLDFYAEGLKALQSLKARIVAYDARLSEKEVPPDGEAYEGLLDLLSLSPGAVDPLLQAVDAASEGLISTLDHAGALDSEHVLKKAYALRSAVVHALGDSERIAAADLSIAELGGGGVESPPSERERG